MKTEIIHEKGIGRLNEDAVSINGNLFGVFDGATSLNSRIFKNGLTGGRLASEIARNIFSQNNDSLINLAEKASSAINEEMLRNNVDITDKESLWSTSAAVVRLNEDTFEWLQIGDSLILIIYKDGSFSIPVTTYNHDSETLSMWKAYADQTDEPIFKVLENQIRKVRSGMNINYGVLNGEQDFSRFVQSGTESLSNISRILLFTDGLFLPSESPSNSSDFNTFVDLFHEGGLQKIRNHVRKMEQADPDCKHYPRFKKHDDIAAIAIDLSEASVVRAA